MRYTVSFCHGLLLDTSSSSVFSLPPYPRMTRMKKKKRRAGLALFSNPKRRNEKASQHAPVFEDLHLTCLTTTYHSTYSIVHKSWKRTASRRGFLQATQPLPALPPCTAGMMLTCRRGLHVAGFVFLVFFVFSFGRAVARGPRCIEHGVN